jgi:hypothetical protein
LKVTDYYYFCIMKSRLWLLLIVWLMAAGAAFPWRRYQPGQEVSRSYLKVHGSGAFFSVTPLPDTVFALMQGKTYPKHCPVPRTELRYLRCLHVNAKGRVLVGEMVLNKLIAGQVLEIFRQLYNARYPIERMRLADNWGGNDEAMMRDNNSSSFNFRYISGTKTISKHGRGLAVDINTLYNPYHKFSKGREVIEPSTGAPYLKRDASFPYKIQRGDLCYRLFRRNGFSWGGDWKNSKDYQHFEWR